MGKKLIIVLTLIFLFVFFFNKKIISQIIIFNSQKWIGYSVSLNISKIDIISGTLEINQVKVKNKDNFFNENIFKADEIKINFSLKSFVSDLVVLDKVILINPIFYFEIKNLKNDDKKIKDNLDLAEKFSDNHQPKIYPKKKQDKNFIIYNLEIEKLKVMLKYPKNDKNLKINLSNMNFINVGNSAENNKKFTHYKDIMSIVLSSTFYQISDFDLRSFIKKNYKIK